MKKVLSVLFTAIMIAGGFLLISTAKAETAVQDQYCATGSDDSYEVVGQNGVNSQTFVPTKNRLSYVNLRIGGVGLSGGTAITMTILESFNGSVIGTKSVLPTITEPSVRQWVFATPLTLDTSKTYQIKVEKSGSGTVYWYYGTGDQTCDGNNRTYGFRDTTHQSWDFNYETYGYIYTAPANDNTNTSNSNTNAAANANTNSVTIPAGQSAGSGDAPATTTSSAIKAASGLTALYSNNAANLAWSASTTTNIDGYKIFRSEAETTGFTEIGKTVKATLQYVDNVNLTAGKTYYYFVRAYKTTAQSASTDTVSLLIPETAATNSNTNTTVSPISASDSDNTDYGLIQLYWIAGWIVSVLIVILAAYEIDQKRKGGFAGAKHFRLIK